MTPEEIKSALEKLADLTHYLTVLDLDKEKAIQSVLTPEQKEQIEDIRAEFGETSEAAQNQIAQYRELIQAAVMAHGETVSAEGAKAIIVSGRKKWNTKGLEGYAVGNPDVLAFFSEGLPSVRITIEK